MIKKFVCAALCVLMLCAAAAIPAYAEVEEPAFSSDKRIAAMNIETGQFVINTAPDAVLQPGATVKMMTAIVAYERIKNLTVQITASSKVKEAKYIGYGGISAPVIGITPGAVYTAKSYLQALLTAAANDAAVALADYASGGDIETFVDWMNEKATEIGTVNTNYTNCTGLQDSNSYTCLSDVAIIAAELFSIKDLADMAGAGVVSNEMGRFHSKNYLTSDSLVRDYKMGNVTGLCAGQYTETSGYSLVAAAESNGLSYTFVIMEGSAEQRDATTGERWFAPDNAYKDMKLLVPWATTGFKYVRILSREKYIREIPVNFSMKADYVLVVPENDVECLLPVTIDPEKDIELVETWDVESLNAPVEKGEKVGSSSIMQNGYEIARIRLITDASLEESALLTLGNKVSLFLKNKYTITVIRLLVIALIIYAAVSLAMFIFRIVRKYVRGAKDNEESMTVESKDKNVK